MEVAPGDEAEAVGESQLDVIEAFTPVPTCDMTVADARRAVGLAPSDGSMINTLGVALYRAGEFAEAVSLFQRVSSESEFYVQAKFFEGITHVQMRRAQPAIGAFRALRDAATTPESKRALRYSFTGPHALSRSSSNA